LKKRTKKLLFQSIRAASTDAPRWTKREQAAEHGPQRGQGAKVFWFFSSEKNARLAFPTLAPNQRSATMPSLRRPATRC
jgi:hypothetical protein